MSWNTINLQHPFAKLALWITGATIYVQLFYEAHLGLNALVFSILAIGTAALSYPELRHQKPSRWLAAAFLSSAALVAWRNSDLSIMVFFLCFLVFSGHLHRRPLRFLWFAGLLGITKLLGSPIAACYQLIRSWPSLEWKPAVRWSPFAILPIGLGLVFGTLYYHANPQFAAFWQRFWPGSWLHLDWEAEQALLFLIGSFVVGGLIWPSLWGDFLKEWEAPFRSVLRRKRSTPKPKAGTLGLKREYQTGVFTLAILNGLLFVANLADLRFVWINYGQATPQELSQYVHEGTSLLILSILMAMGVLLWFFRSNLNFLPDNERLRWLAYLWLAQNAMLILSVGLRNWQYVANFGLAYKRLGVFGFLLATLAGLWLVYLKTRDKRTITFVLQRSAQLGLVLLLLYSTVNWDRMITRYNIRQAAPGKLDVEFLTRTLPPVNLPTLWEERHRLQVAAGWTEDELTRKLKAVSSRLKKQHRPGWRSWNYTTSRARRGDPFRDSGR
ncbi:MAG: DUF4173 domain-containing protein [Phaeodactylibacter sp.]|uniref:DUF4153 domain-containing protein n=1 Tax=Phaeodactylibacter sp. TaxID=1940289 RepID=UPI0032EED24A